MTTTMDDFLTELIVMDPKAIALVGKGANGFLNSAFIEKALAEVTEEAIKAFVDGLCGVNGCEVCKGRYDSLLRDRDFSFLEKAKLKAKERNALPDSDFALPGRRYPIHDESHARNALSRVSQNGTPEEKAKVRAAVHRRYPDIGADTEEDAEKMTVSTSESETQTHEVSEDVGEGSPPYTGDGGAPRSVSQPKPDESDGEGDTAPDKSVPKGEALSQTPGAQKDLMPTPTGANDVPAPAASVDGRGDVLADQKMSTSEALSQTNAVEKDAMGMGMSNGSADTNPGNPAWEAKDAALADHAGQLLLMAHECIQLLGNRERAEKGPLFSAKTEGALRSLTEVLPGLITTTPPPTVSKEIEEMTPDELAKMLDERDERLVARFADVVKAKKKNKKPPMAGDGDGDGEGSTGDTAKGAAAPEAATPEAAADTAVKSESDRLAALEEMVAKIAGEDGKRPIQNGAGIAGGAVAPGGAAVPVTREGAPVGEPGSVFKALEDQIATEADPQRKADLHLQLTKAKMIANDRAREANPQLAGSRFGPNATPLFTNRKALPDDPTIIGVNGGRRGRPAGR